jgi:hypothetical protein
MNGGRVATWALAVLAVVGVAGMFAVWQAGNGGGVEWSGRGPGEAALLALALLQLSFSVALPAFATLTAASALALAIVALRVAAEHWAARGASAATAGSDGRAHDERARLDVEVGADD